MVVTLCALVCEGAFTRVITCVCTSGGAHTCRAGGLAPPRLQAAPELPTRQPLPEGLPPAWPHLPHSHGSTVLCPENRASCLLWEPQFPCLHSGWLGEG